MIKPRKDEDALWVLVVEDEERMAVLLQRGLREEGYSVDVAADGHHGLVLASQATYDAILLDAMLPGIDGFEVCARLRQVGVWVPVIMLTARDAVEDRVRGLDAGADDYLVKPFAFAELLARLRAFLRRDKTERTRLLTVGDLCLDPVSLRVSRSGASVELTVKEFALLELLMRHPGQVLSRDLILDHVWDFAHAAGSNVVDQYVGYLRRKLDRPFDRHDIETVRGAGYRLRASDPSP